MVEDQRFAARRPDVLVYESDVLAEDVTIAGPIIADLYVSTTGTDADWIVKLIDVYPSDAPDPRPNPSGVRMGDYQMLLAGEVFRSKYRTSFEHPGTAITPFSRGTASWSRSKAPGFRSSTAIRRSSRTSTGPGKRTSGARCTPSTGRAATPRVSGST
jgi:hypothetical protein